MLLINQSMVLGAFGSAVLGWLMFFLSVFLILLILVQRGKGGGLAGALGGPGGQSAFGSKAGDTFTVITAVSAIVWGLVCAVAMYTMGVPPTTADDVSFEIDEKPPALTTPADESAGGAGGLSGLSGFLSEESDTSTEDGAALTPAEEESESVDETTADSEPANESSEGEGSDDAPADDDSSTPSAELESTETDASSDSADDSDEGSE